MLDAPSVIHGAQRVSRYMHQYAYWMNDMSAAAFSAHSHGVLDFEMMLGARADAHPASSNGLSEDKLHFCQPGPADWALDSVVRHISSQTS